MTESEYSVLLTRASVFAKYLNMKAQGVKDELSGMKYVGNEEQAYWAITALENSAKELKSLKNFKELKQNPENYVDYSQMMSIIDTEKPTR